VLLVTQTQPARAALSFTLVVLATCGLFLLLAAPFLFAATIIVYAGAIIVIFLFVLMLAQQTGRDDADLRSREPLLSVLTGFVLLGTLFFLIQRDTATNGEVPVNEVTRLADVAGQAARAETADELRELVEAEAVVIQGERLDLPRLFLEQTRGLLRNDRVLRDAYVERIEDEVRFPWVALGKDYGEAAVAERRKLLATIHTYGTQLAQAPQSRFSGPVGVPTTERRKGPDGLPAMPAENTTYLGKSLFTDYLLPVELGGILLLVAVVGAIVIAQRQDEQGKENA
jgi:NADH:ubiquinone oxidoreductase subunit 6 (subunit J)